MQYRQYSEGMELFRPLSRMIGMGRPARIHFPGAVYHVRARGVNGCAIFIDDDDRKKFLNDLFRIANESSGEIIAYCLMGNHFHIAFRVRHIPLAAIMLRLLTGYAQSFNRRYDRTGHLFQARYEASLCLDDAYLFNLVRYIHMNPVRAGLILRPQDWPWSSSSIQPPGNSEGDLADFDPWPKDAVTVDLARLDHVNAQNIDEIGAGVAALTGVRLEELRSGSRSRRIIAAKRIFAREAGRQGHRVIAIARWLSLDQSSVGRYIRENTADTAWPATNIISSR